MACGIDLMDMMASNNLGSENIDISIVNSLLLFLVFTEEEYLEFQADNLIESFSKTFSFTNVEKEIITETVAGKECTGIRFSGDMALDANASTIKYYEEVVIYKNDKGYAALLMATCFDSDNCKKLLDGFYALEEE